MPVDDVFHDGKPKPGSPSFARPGGVHPVKSFRQTMQVFAGNPFAIILNRDPQRVAVNRRLDLHGAAMPPILDGVLHQIAQNLGDLVRIAIDRRQTIGNLGDNMDVALAGDRL